MASNAYCLAYCRMVNPVAAAGGVPKMRGEIGVIESKRQGLKHCVHVLKRWLECEGK